MRKSTLFYLLVVAITLICAYAVVLHDGHSPFVVEKKSRQAPELPNFNVNEFWNFLAQPR